LSLSVKEEISYIERRKKCVLKDCNFSLNSSYAWCQCRERGREAMLERMRIRRRRRRAKQWRRKGKREKKKKNEEANTFLLSWPCVSLLC